MGVGKRDDCALPKRVFAVLTPPDDEELNGLNKSMSATKLEFILAEFA